MDLRRELEGLVRSRKIGSGVLLSCVGGISAAKLRMAGSRPGGKAIKSIDGDLEIVSAEGTLCEDGIHIHIGVSDKNGNVLGGHLLYGCLVRMTAEIVIGESQSHKFRRQLDRVAGFNELEIE